MGIELVFASHDTSPGESVLALEEQDKNWDNTIPGIDTATETHRSGKTDVGFASNAGDYNNVMELSHTRLNQAPSKLSSSRSGKPNTSDLRPWSTAVAHPDLSRVTEEDEDEDDSVISVHAAPVKKQALLSVMEKWRKAAAPKHHETTGAEKNRSTDDSTDETSREDTQVSERSGMQKALSNMEITTTQRQELRREPRIDSSTNQLKTARSVDRADREVQQMSAASVQVRSIEDERLLARAARARQIYIASKYLNIWADITARRLEREAVARRHMVRFRCFQAWIQAPSIHMPVAEQLRATTALQKLRRAIKDQNRQLREIAAALSQRRKMRMVAKALEHWNLHRQEDLLRQGLVQRARTKAATRWLVSASDHKALDHLLLIEKQKAKESKALHGWQVAAERGATRRHAAAQIGHAHIGLGYLREWWDRAELFRRSQLYQAATAKDKASIAFDTWNLKARVQAFIWKTDYEAATKAFDLWYRTARSSKDAAAAAQDSARRYLLERSWIQLRKRSSQWATLDRLRRRTHLYICAMKGLSSTDRFLDAKQEEEQRRKRTQREKEAREEKEYLERMYMEASSRRKKRDFFKALDKWKAITRDTNKMSKKVNLVQTEREIRRCKSIWRNWQSQAERHQQEGHAIRSHRGLPWWDVWKTTTELQADRDMQAWGIWALRKQRQYLRAWSFHSLHQGGQAHTATAVRERHALETRYRRLQDWRQATVGLAAGTASQRHSMFDDDSDASMDMFRLASVRRSTRTMLRPDTVDDALEALQTPSRSTGAQGPFDATPLSRSRGKQSFQRPRVAKTLVTSLPPRVSTSAGSRIMQSQMPVQLPTTTPQAPVPNHLRQVSLSLAQLEDTSDTEGGPTQIPSRLFPTKESERNSSGLAQTMSSHQLAASFSTQPYYSRFDNESGPIPQALFPPRHRNRSVAGYPVSGNKSVTNRATAATPFSSAKTPRKRSAWLVSAASRVPSNLAPSRSLRASRMLEEKDHKL